MFAYIFVTLSILQSQFIEKGIYKKKNENSEQMWCYCSFYLRYITQKMLSMKENLCFKTVLCRSKNMCWRTPGPYGAFPLPVHHDAALPVPATGRRHTSVFTRNSGSDVRAKAFQNAFLRQSKQNVNEKLLIYHSTLYARNDL